MARTSKAGILAAAALPISVMFAPVADGIYTVQNNELGSGAAESITTNRNADFTVANSAIDNATNGAPGGYPSIYQGCYWGTCTSGGRRGL